MTQSRAVHQSPAGTSSAVSGNASVACEGETLLQRPRRRGAATWGISGSSGDLGGSPADPLPVLAVSPVFSSLCFLSLGFWIYDARCSTSREDESPPGVVQCLQQGNVFTGPSYRCGALRRPNRWPLLSAFFCSLCTR